MTRRHSMAATSNSSLRMWLENFGAGWSADRQITVVPCYLHSMPAERLPSPASSGKERASLTRVGMQAALLPDRGVLKVVGDDARKFLNGLVTCDMAKVTPASARFAALLTPQGKIIADFIIAEAQAEDGGGFFLDCPRPMATTLVDRLNFYKLRAKVICEDLSEVLGVMAAWDGAGESEYGLCYADPRLPTLGIRLMLPPHVAPQAAADLGATLT